MGGGWERVDGWPRTKKGQGIGPEEKTGPEGFRPSLKGWVIDRTSNSILENNNYTAYIHIVDL